MHVFTRRVEVYCCKAARCTTRRCILPSAAMLHRQFLYSQKSRRNCLVYMQARAASISAGLDALPRYRYSPRFGLPIVHESVSYGKLLQDIRTEKVEQLCYFVLRDSEMSNGACLVVYKDGSLAQGFIPSYDFRTQYAIEHHNVKVIQLEPEPRPELLKPSNTDLSKQMQLAITYFPYAAVALTYLGVRWALKQKGDADDRAKLKEKAKADREKAKQQVQMDKMAQEAETMAKMGMSLPEIRQTLMNINIPFEEEDLRATVERAQKAAAKEDSEPTGIYNTQAEEQILARKELQARLADAESAMAAEERMKMGEMSTEDAAGMLQMRSVKISLGSKKKTDAMARKIREAQRRLKGIKLQHTGDEDTVGFDDVAGIGDAKVELMEVVDFFTKPELFKNSGSRIPKGVLLCGPPGTGKTLLARAVAGEAGVAFLSLNASEFVEMFAGVGAARVRDLFKQARDLAPSIIFIDEIDAVGRVRGGEQGNDERDNTLNMMLSEMDGFDEQTNVIVMAATNRRDVLDPALIRAGRFDRTVYVGLPDFNGRIEVLQVHMAKHAVAPLTTEQLHSIAFETQRFSGAQLANLVNLAAMFAARDDRGVIEYEDFNKALVWERLGPERPPYSGERQRRIACQEAATALMCTLLPAIEPVVSVTVVPREKYPLGHTVVKINEGRELNKLFTRTYLEQQLLCVLAGRAAEELVYGRDGMSSLNQRRLVLARRIVQKLVVSNAMSDNPKLGARTISRPVMVQNKSIVQDVHRLVTAELHQEADLEMEQLLNSNYALAKQVLHRNRLALDGLISELMMRNTMSGDAVRALVQELADPLDLQRRNAEKAVFM